MVKVQTAEGDVELDDEDRFLLRVLIREIRQTSYVLEEGPAWGEFLKLRLDVYAERKAPDEVRSRSGQVR